MSEHTFRSESTSSRNLSLVGGLDPAARKPFFVAGKAEPVKAEPVTSEIVLTNHKREPKFQHGVAAVKVRKPRKPRSPRPPRGLMDLALVAAAYTEHAPERERQRSTLSTTSNEIEAVARDLRRQAEAPMLDGLQGDSARIAYLTLALNLVDTADAMEDCVRSLTMVETAMREANEEHERIGSIQLAPAQRSLLALGEPIAVAVCGGRVPPAEAEKAWLGEIDQQQRVAGRAAMDRFAEDMARASALLRTVTVPTFPGPDPDPQPPEIIPGPVTPMPFPHDTITGVETVADDPLARGRLDEGAGAAPLTSAGAAGAAAAGGGAAYAASRGGGGGGRASAGGGGGAAAEKAPAWVSQRHLHDTGPDGSMDPAAAASDATSTEAPSAATTGGESGGAAMAPPLTGPGAANGAGEEESGTAVARTAEEDEAAAAAVALGTLGAAGSRGSVTAAEADSSQW